MRRLFPAAVLCLLICGCVHRPVAAGGAGETALFWPPPPETKRIVFVKAVSRPGDLGIHPGLFTRVARYLGGIPEAGIASPYGIARDAEGRLYVVDTRLRCVHVFDPRRNRYRVFPADRRILETPVGIAVDDASGRIFVTDARLGVVRVFADGGKRLVSTLGKDLFKRPTGIVVNRKTSELLVVDTLRARVFRFDLSGLALKGSFGGIGMAAGRFHYPTLIAVAPSGRVIVSDSLNFRVQVFSPTGRFLFKIGTVGTVPGTFSRPKGVAVDSDGNIYVVDSLFDNIQMFDRRGRLLMAFGGHGAGPGDFDLPTAIYIDHRDVIYVSDTGNRRIQIFKYLKEEKGK